MVIELDVDLKGVREKTEQVARVLPNLQAHIEVAVARRVEARTISVLRTPPAPNSEADYPLRWKSQKQRRYVIAKLRREGNLPYRRTGALTEAWRVRTSRTVDGAVLEVVNASGKIIDYVAGEGKLRQPMFPRWYNYQRILRGERDRLRKEIRAYFKRRTR